MKILFICGSLEPGRDGVGDYTRKLAAALMAEGNKVTAVAFNDKKIDDVRLEAQECGNYMVPTFRIPSSLSPKHRAFYLRKWIDEFDPDAISLQFVSFSFHPKGLSVQLSNLLRAASYGRKWHIMFHELWVGMSLSDSFKIRMWGKLQKNLIKEIIRKLKPILIHTQCDLFYQQLQKEKYPVEKLPLFSNIDVGESDSIKKEMEIKYAALKKDASLKCVFFGGLHPEAKLMEFISQLKELEKAGRGKFKFLYIGRSGVRFNEHMDILNKEEMPYNVFGELDATEISYLLSISSFGITTSSPQMLEKNGTVAAMIAHRLPVICIGRDLVIENIAKIPKMKGTYNLNDIDKLVSEKADVCSYHRPLDIARKFLHDLQLMK